MILTSLSIYGMIFRLALSGVYHNIKDWNRTFGCGLRLIVIFTLSLYIFSERLRKVLSVATSNLRGREDQ